eukprot:GILK01008888.1.p2 GENE.GILK01008888.1~~GILK01008888.1.p2  ORF type:complete len:153 (-),score=3.03 GILK01008888.1:545-967(-)
MAILGRLNGMMKAMTRDPKYEVFELHLTGREIDCCCFARCGDSLKVQQNEMFLAPELNGIYTLAEFQHFANEMNEALRKSMMPCNTPCTVAHYGAMRERLLKELLNGESMRLASQGIYWEFISVGGNGLRVTLPPVEFSR